MVRADISPAGVDIDDLLDELHARYEYVVFAGHNVLEDGKLDWRFYLQGKNMAGVLASASYLNHTANRTLDQRTTFSEPAYNITANSGAIQDGRAT